jgi:hypothetical protein
LGYLVHAFACRPQGILGEVKPPALQVTHGRAPGHGTEPLSERGARHRGRSRELAEVPRQARLGVHEAHRGREARIGQPAQPPRRPLHRRPGGDRAENIEQEQLRQVRKREPGTFGHTAHLFEQRVQEPRDPLRTGARWINGQVLFANGGAI